MSIVIPNFNGGSIIKECIKSCYLAVASPLISEFEIIISDDNSNDNSIEIVNQEFPDVKIVTNHEERGFATNVNNGVNHANFNLVLILNNDIRLTKNYFEDQLPHLESPEVFGTMGTILNEDNQRLGARFLKYSSFGIENKNESPENLELYYTHYLSGANALVKRDLFISLGGFCPLFTPYYYEDAELGLKVWLSGYRCLYIKESECLHLGSSTIDKEDDDYRRLITKRNKLIISYAYLERVKLYYFNIIVLFKLAHRATILDKNYVKAIMSFLKLKGSINRYKSENGISGSFDIVNQLVEELNLKHSQKI